MCDMEEPEFQQIRLNSETIELIIIMLSKCFMSFCSECIHCTLYSLVPGSCAAMIKCFRVVPRWSWKYANEPKIRKMSKVTHRMCVSLFRFRFWSTTYAYYICTNPVPIYNNIKIILLYISFSLIVCLVYIDVYVYLDCQTTNYVFNWIFVVHKVIFCTRPTKIEN